MAEPTDPNAPATESAPMTLEPIVRNEDAAAVKKLNDDMATLKQRFDDAAAAAKKWSSLGDTKQAEQFERASKALKDNFDRHVALKQKVIDGAVAVEALSAAHVQLDKTAKSSGDTVIGVMGMIRNAIKGVSKEMQPMLNLLGSAAPLVAAKMADSAVKGFDSWSGGMLTIQDQMLDFNKHIQGMSMSFGTSFDKARGTLGEYNDRWAETILALKVGKDDVRKVTDAFANTVPIEDQIQAITKLSTATHGMMTTLTMTNAAILVGAATGTEAAEITKLMGEAYYELGATTDVAVAGLGKIQWAAKGSGIAFAEAGKAINAAAGSLKQYGGTVASVAPLFKSFAESMTQGGIGRKGLTVELFKSFVDGISKMEFGTRALMGITGPGGGGKGALGAGLEMEAAMEDQTGEGMKKITDSMMSTLKQFGGGKILTREEAIEDPAQEKNFLIQRQMLSQLFKISDPGMANKTLNMLQDIDKNGMAVGDDGQNALGELLGSGQKEQDSTQSIIKQTSQMLEVTTRKSGENIVKAVGDLGGKMGMGKAFGALMDSLKVSAATGKVDMAQFKRLIEMVGKAGLSDSKRGAKTKKAAKPAAPAPKRQRLDALELPGTAIPAPSFDFAGEKGEEINIPMPEEGKLPTAAETVAQVEAKRDKAYGLGTGVATPPTTPELTTPPTPELATPPAPELPKPPEVTGFDFAGQKMEEFDLMKSIEASGAPAKSEEPSVIPEKAKPLDVVIMSSTDKIVNAINALNRGFGTNRATGPMPRPARTTMASTKMPNIDRVLEKFVSGGKVPVSGKELISTVSPATAAPVAPLPPAPPEPPKPPEPPTAPTAPTTEAVTPAIPASTPSWRDKLAAKAKAGLESVGRDNDALRKYIDLQKSGKTGLAPAPEKMPEIPATARPGEMAAAKGMESARNTVNAPTAPLAPPIDQSAKVTQGVQQAAAAATTAAKPATAKQEIPVEVELSAKVKGTSIIIDLAPAISAEIRKVYVEGNK